MNMMTNRNINILVSIAILAFVAFYFIREIRETFKDSNNEKIDKYSELLNYQYKEINSFSLSTYSGFDTEDEIPLSDFHKETLFNLLQFELEHLSKSRVNATKSYWVDIEFRDGVRNRILLSFENDDYLLVSFEDRKFDSEKILEFFVHNDFFKSH